MRFLQKEKKGGGSTAAQPKDGGASVTPISFCPSELGDLPSSKMAPPWLLPLAAAGLVAGVWVVHWVCPGVGTEPIAVLFQALQGRFAGLWPPGRPYWRGTGGATTELCSPS